MSIDADGWGRYLPLALLLLGAAVHLVALLALFGPLAAMAVSGHPGLTVFFWILLIVVSGVIAIMAYTIARVAGWAARRALPTRYDPLSIGRGMALAAGALAWLFWTYFNLHVLAMGVGHAPTSWLGPYLLLVPVFGAAYGATIAVTTLMALWRLLR